MILGQLCSETMRLEYITKIIQPLTIKGPQTCEIEGIAYDSRQVKPGYLFVALHGAHKDGAEPVSWFGGGMDLTPYYPFEDDIRHFHTTCKRALDPFGDDVHARYKRWCDEYFFLKHRNEPRGVGGVFFDDLNEPGFETSFAMTRAVGDAFIPAYAPILERRAGLAHGERERDFQLLRRGRYVEFNLIYDRGTIFGLKSGGRAESILCSMPAEARWRYDWQPEPGSPEARLFTDFLPPRDWV